MVQSTLFTKAASVLGAAVAVLHRRSGRWADARALGRMTPDMREDLGLTLADMQRIGA